jgi:enterochelin esterase-like enzyme
MKSTILIASLICSTALYSEESKPKTPMNAAPISPEIGKSDVTFRIQAPQAKEVKLKLRAPFGGDTQLTKGEKGMWTATLTGVKPGVWEYSFLVDGLNIIDPLNPVLKPQRSPNTSILHVPSEPPAPWDLTKVPHGVVHQMDYYSRATKSWKGLTIYTPPGALADPTPLPVLYLSHGYSDNEKSWTTHGKAHWILDNLIAEGKAKPMIIVMPDGHAIPPSTGWKEEYGQENTRLYAEDLVTDVVPLVQKTFRVNPNAEARAFAGLSMGGRHAIYVAMNHHDKFRWVGAFSSAIPNAEQLAAGVDKAAATNADLKLFWVACGKNDFLFKANEEFNQLLTTKGVKHEYAVTEGDHSWPIWRDYLVTFAQRLF